MSENKRWHLWKHHAQEEFNHWAETYDQSVLNRLLFRRCYLKFIELILKNYPDRESPLKLLDVGCGTGTFAAMLGETDLPIHPIGFDMAEMMCRLGHEKAKLRGLEKTVHFITGDSEHLPFADGSFDIITCSNSFHHYPHQEHVLAEMNRILKPGGSVIIIDGYRDNVLGWFIFDVCVEMVEKSVRHCSASRMRNILKEADFDDIVQDKFGYWVPVLATIAKKQYRREPQINTNELE